MISSCTPPYTNRFENYMLAAFKTCKKYNTLQVLLYISRHGRSPSWLQKIASIYEYINLSGGSSKFELKNKESTELCKPINGRKV